jgi:hypothetical protein
VNVTNVTNVYNNPRADRRALRQRRTTSTRVTAVPTQAFVQAQPVQRAAVRMDRNALRATQVVAPRPIAPARASMTRRAAAARRHGRDQRVMDRKVVARQAPRPRPRRSSAGKRQ